MNIPFLCVAIAFALLYTIKIPLSVAMARLPGGFDNKTPRDQQAKLEGWGKRAVAAQSNGYESFPPFAAAVLMAHLAHANARWTAAMAIGHVVARALYQVCYLANVDKPRSLVWGIAVACSAGIMLLAIFE
jgi:uncharacterized MAPEG superfamily protein